MNQKLKKFTAISMATLLSLTAAPVSAFAESYTKLEKAALTEAITDFVTDYGKNLEVLTANYGQMHEDITFTLDDAGRSLLGFLIPVDMSWFKDIRLSADISAEESSQYMSTGLYLNDTKLCTLEYLFDMESLEIYMRIPELRDGYIKVNYEETLKQQENLLKQQQEALEDNTEIDQAAEEALEAVEDSLFNDPQFMKDYMAVVSNLPEYIPDSSIMEELLQRYTDILFSHIKDTEKAGTETLDVTGVTKECTVYEGRLSQADTQALLKEVLNTAKEDEQIQDILNKVDEEMTAVENLHQSFADALGNAADELNEELEDDGSYISAKVWMDEDGKAARRSLELVSDEESMLVYDWMNISDGSNVRNALVIGPEGEGIGLGGEGTIENGILSGNWKLRIGDQKVYENAAEDTGEYISIDVENYDTTASKEGRFQGSYTFSFPAELSSSEDPTASIANPLQNFEFLLDINSERDNGNVDLTLLSAGEALGSLSLSAASGATVEKPDFEDMSEVYDALDEAAMNEYVSGITLDLILENLVAAGMPEELLMQLLTGGTSTDAEVLPEENAGSAVDEAEIDTAP